MKFINSIYFKIVAFVIILLVLFFESFIQADKDFDVFIGASNLIAEGKDCYDVWIHCAGNGLKYFYSPLFAGLLFPFRSLSQLSHNLLWMSLSFFFIYRTCILVLYFLPLKKFPEKQKYLYFILLLVLTARYILDNLALGQMTFLLVWGSLESMRLVYEKKFIYGAALLALIINFKLIPITLLAYLFYKKEFKAAAFTLIFFITYLFLPAIVLGFEFNNLLLESWFHSLSATNANSILEDSGRPSFSSWIPSLAMNTPIEFAMKRNFVNLNAPEVNTILNLLRLCFLVLLVWLFEKPFRSINSKRMLFYDVSLLCLVTPLFFPHQGKYAIYYLLPAYAYCVFLILKLHRVTGISKYKRLYRQSLMLLIVSFVLVTLTTDGLIGRHLSNVAEYLHLITYGALCLLYAVMLLKPAKNSN